jgi:hypothetical protein
VFIASAGELGWQGAKYCTGQMINILNVFGIISPCNLD